VHLGEDEMMKFQNKVIHYLKRAFFVWRQDGFRAVLQRVLKKFKNANINSLVVDESDDIVTIQISIIMPVYNAVDMTKACIESIYRETRNTAFEVLVIDNASKDGTTKWLNTERQKHSNIKVFRMPKNIGFGPAVNFGLRKSKGKFIVILNNDTMVAPGWLENLLLVMDADETIGIVSPVTNYVGEGPQIDELALSLEPDPVAIAQYARSISTRDDIIYESNRLVFFCVLVRRELVDLIGYLDEIYERGNFEDDDYCLRARMVGYRLAISRSAFVYHHGTATFKSNRISHNQWMELNRGRFYRKAGRIATSMYPNKPFYLKRKTMISVIVRTKDRPRLLKKTLTSLANQTFRDFEVILVNDGEEDVSVLSEFKMHFPITYVHHVMPKGRTAAINSGLECIKGKWIAYLDDDDILYPWHFEALLQAADVSDAGVVYSDYNRVLFANSENLFPLRLIGVPSWEYDRDEILVQNFIPIHSYFHLSKYIDEIGIWNESLDRLEDYEFLLRLRTASEFYHLKKVTCEYRFYLDGVDSISSGKQEYLEALQLIYKEFPVVDEKIKHERQMVINAVRLQAKRIDEFVKEAGHSQAEKMAVKRKIIRLVTGM
jgi:GT2 family glycosyltransferase